MTNIEFTLTGCANGHPVRIEGRGAATWRAVRGALNAVGPRSRSTRSSPCSPASTSWRRRPRASRRRPTVRSSRGCAPTRSERAESTSARSRWWRWSSDGSQLPVHAAARGDQGRDRGRRAPGRPSRSERSPRCRSGTPWRCSRRQPSRPRAGRELRGADHRGRGRRGGRSAEVAADCRPTLGCGGGEPRRPMIATCAGEAPGSCSQCPSWHLFRGPSRRNSRPRSRATNCGHGQLADLADASAFHR